jgi:hypothetical protein
VFPVEPDKTWIPSRALEFAVFPRTSLPVPETAKPTPLLLESLPTAVHQDTELLVAVADILSGGTTYYTPETIDLANATDLKHETMLAEYISSCGNFDFSIGVCNGLINFPKLITDQGDFYL